MLWEKSQARQCAKGLWQTIQLANAGLLGVGNAHKEFKTLDTQRIYCGLMDYI